VRLRTQNGGELLVEGTEGEIDATNINGSIHLINVSGAAVAHAQNGRIEAVFARVDPDKPMSFSSMNGRIDLTFPADLRANLKLRNRNGEVLTDFEVRLAPSGPTSLREKVVNAKVNGGGPEIQVSNFNGAIYIRKAGK
jgi:DUF4097 and DUF4098 domain-containing protein YvlB